MKPVIAQIIYPIKYRYLFFKRKKKLLLPTFIENLKKTLSIKDDLILLGRARTGIYLLVKYFLKKDKNNYVLIAPFTIPDVINMIIQAGGRPFFLDFKKNSTFLCLENLKKAIKEKNPSILILTHYSVNEEAYFEIFKLCKYNNIKLIEDSAISFNGKSNNVEINSLSDGSIFSFSSFKFLNYFFGGALRCKDKATFKKINDEVKNWKIMNFNDYKSAIYPSIKHYLMSMQYVFNFFTLPLLKIKNNKIIKNYTPFKFGTMEESYFKRPSEGCLKELNSKLKTVKIFQEHRRKISLIYLKYLKNISIPKNIDEKKILESSCNHYLIATPRSKILRNRLLDKNFHTGKLFYENCSELDVLKNYEGNTKNISKLIENLILLPTHFKISEQYATEIAKEIKRKFANDH